MSRVRLLVTLLVVMIVVGAPTITSAAQKKGTNDSCTVWTRDISRGGASFICPFEVLGRKVVLGFKLGDGTVKWYPAEIVRERQIPDEQFWEYGTVFRDVEDETEPQ